MTEEILKIINDMYVSDFLPYLSVAVKHVDKIDGQYIGITENPDIIVLFPPIEE